MILNVLVIVLFFGGFDDSFISLLAVVVRVQSILIVVCEVSLAIVVLLDLPDILT